MERRSSSAADAASVIPAESCSVAAAIRSSIFCWRAPEMLLAAGLRRWVGADAEPGDGWTLGRRSAALPAPSADVFIRDFGPLAASVFKGAELAAAGPVGLVCGGFPADPGRRGFGVNCSVMPGFFRIAKSV